jgi:hypothetical protein
VQNPLALYGVSLKMAESRSRFSGVDSEGEIEANLFFRAYAHCYFPFHSFFLPRKHPRKPFIVEVGLPVPDQRGTFVGVGRANSCPTGMTPPAAPGSFLTITT